MKNQSDNLSQQVAHLASSVAQIRAALQKLETSAAYTFQKNIQVLDGRNIQVGGTQGTQIGTTALQKIGFFGVAPVVQGGAVSDPTGGSTIDSQARSSIIALINRLEDIGIIA